MSNLRSTLTLAAAAWYTLALAAPGALAYVLVGPKNMPPAQVAYWDAIFAKTVQTDEWKKFVETTGWEPGYKNSRDAATYLKAENDEAKSLLTELGMATAK